MGLVPQIVEFLGFSYLVGLMGIAVLFCIGVLKGFLMALGSKHDNDH